MASKTMLFLLGIFLLLLAVQLQVDAGRILQQQLQEAIPRMKGMTNLEGADEKYTKPEFGLMSKRLAQKDAEGGCNGNTKSDIDWQKGLAGLGELLSQAASSEKGSGSTTQTTPGTGSHTHATPKQK